MTYGINIIIKTLIATALAILLGNGSVVAFNHFPSNWFEDWDTDNNAGQTDRDKSEHNRFGMDRADARMVLPEKLVEADNAGRQRLPSTPWKYLFVGIFGISGVWLSITSNISYEISVLILLWVVLEMAIADWLYRIVPDQLQLLLAVSAIGFAQFNENWWEPLAGAGIGLAISMSVWGLGMLLFRGGSLGGADIKFFLCMGFVAGRTGIVIIFVLTTLFFAAYSALKIAMRRGSLRDVNPMLPPAFAATMVYFLMLYHVADMFKL